MKVSEYNAFSVDTTMNVQTEKYQGDNLNTPKYEVFNASMIVDTQLERYSNLIRLAGKSCQQCRSQCYGCKTGFTGRSLEKLSSRETEKILESLLKVA